MLLLCVSLILHINDSGYLKLQSVILHISLFFNLLQQLFDFLITHILAWILCLSSFARLLVWAPVFDLAFFSAVPDLLASRTPELGHLTAYAVREHFVKLGFDGLGLCVELADVLKYLIADDFQACFFVNHCFVASQLYNTISCLLLSYFVITFNWSYFLLNEAFYNLFLLTVQRTDDINYSHSRSVECIELLCHFLLIVTQIWLLLLQAQSFIKSSELFQLRYLIYIRIVYSSFE